MASFSGSPAIIGESTVPDDDVLWLGTQETTGFEPDTAQTNDALVLWLSSNYARTLLLLDYAARGDNYALAAQTNPTLAIFSATRAATATNQYLTLQHNATDAIITVGTGILRFQDASGNPLGVSLGFADGTEAAPSIFFTSDTDNGAYRAAANDWHLVVGGDTFLRATASIIVFNEDATDRDLRIESVNNANMFGIDAANNGIGIGIAPASNSTIRVAFGATGHIVMGNFVDVTTQTDIATGESIYGLSIAYAASRTTAGAFIAALRGIVSDVRTLAAASPVDWTNSFALRSFESNIIVAAPSSGTHAVTGAAGFLFDGVAVGAGATLTNLYGVYITNSAGAGTLTNQYGIYIENLTKGGTIDYGIYIAGADTLQIFADGTTASRFDGPVTHADGTEAAPSITFTSDLNNGAYYAAADDWHLVVGGDTFLRATATIIVLNEDATDRDLRIESVGNANMFGIDAGNNGIGIGLAPFSGSAMRVGYGVTGNTVMGYFLDTSTHADIATGTSLRGILITASASRTTAGNYTGALVGVLSNIETRAASNPVNWTSSQGLQAFNANIVIAAPSVGTHTVTGASAFSIETMSIGAGATLTNFYGVYIPDSIGLGTLTNQYGIYIANLTKGGSDYGIYIAGADTYAIWSDAGANRFDGAVTLGVSLAADTATEIGISVISTAYTIGTSGSLVGPIVAGALDDTTGGNLSGAIGLDTTNNRWYARSGATWRFVAIAGFAFPQYSEEPVLLSRDGGLGPAGLYDETICPLCHKQMRPNEAFGLVGDRFYPKGGLHSYGAHLVCLMLDLPESDRARIRETLLAAT